MSAQLKIVRNPSGEAVRANLDGFRALYRFWSMYRSEGETLADASLVQANSVLDESKPHGQIVVFLGVFFFCLPFSKVKHVLFPFLFF